jgi:hypothetical protein
MLHLFGALGVPECGCLLAVLAFSVFWIWALVDCATKEPNEGNTKVVWILVIIFTHLLGALLYTLIRRPDRIRQFGR